MLDISYYGYLFSRFFFLYLYLIELDFIFWTQVDTVRYRIHIDLKGIYIVIEMCLI